MTSAEFLLLAALLVGLFFLYGLRHSLPAETAEPKEQEPDAPTRWARFRVEPGTLRDGEKAVPVVREEPTGLRLFLVQGDSGNLPLELGEEPQVPVLRLERRLLTCTPTVVLRLSGNPWMMLRWGEDAEYPELKSHHGSRAGNVPSLGALAVQGDVAAREYEIRANGRLAASVTRDVEKASSAKRTMRDHYYVEVLKTSQALPFLALTLALELATAMRAETRVSAAR